MSESILRVAIVGAGYISDFHIKAVTRRDDALLVSLCDLNEQSAKNAVSEFPDVAIYTDTQEMLDEESLDIVHILTQPDSHFNLASMVVNAGCHVLLEKPVTVNSTEALELKRLAEQMNVKLAINHNFVYSRPFKQLLSLVKVGKLGPLKSIRVVWKKALPQVNFGPWNLWMLREPQNILFETGSHSFSELLAITNSPKIINVKTNKPKILPSGSTFFRRWNITAEIDDITIQIDSSYDQGFDQHFVEVEGIFGVARADIENDIFSAELPTGLTYDAERLNVNLKLGFNRIKDALRTFLSFVYSKFSNSSTGSPYETSMINGINSCYELIFGEDLKRESSIDFAIEIAKLAEKVNSRIPNLENSNDYAPEIPKPVFQTQSDCKILIIGASGFIGKKLLKGFIAQNKSVRAMVRNPSGLVGLHLNETSEIIVGDFRNSELMEQALTGIETVYHLAVAHSNSLSGYLRVDSDPTIKLANLCHQKGINRFIYTGTIDSLYLGPGVGIVTEADGTDRLIHRRNNYAHSKALTETRLQKLAKEEGFPLVIIRPAIVLGTGGPVNHIGIANWFGLGKCDYWGNGKNKLPLVLVDDVVSAMITAESAENINGKIYNLSAKPCLSAQDYVSEVESVLSSQVSVGSTHYMQLYFVDVCKWIVKLLVNHPDKRRIPSIRDWRCREQHAEFDISLAQKDLDWYPENDKNIIIEKGIHEPTRLFLEN